MKKLFFTTIYLLLFSLWSCSDGDCGAPICPEGFEGPACDMEMRAKFLGNWEGNLNCDGANLGDDYPFEFTSVGGNILAVESDEDFLCLLTSSTAFDIAFQYSSYHEENVSGSGSIENGVLTMAFTIHYDDGTTDQCQFIGTK